MKTRREFLKVLGGAAVVWPLATRAQQSTLPVIGFLSNASPDMYARRLYAFGQGLKESGFGAARLAAIPAGESPANRGVQSLL